MLGLGLIDALDALGSEPPHISCVEPEINRKICDLVKGKLQSLLSHLTGDPTPPGGVDPEYRTKPLTAAIVKYYMTGEGKKKKRGNPSLWLKRKLKNKTFRGCVRSGNKYILDYRDFQEDAWEHIVTPETWERIRPESPVR